MAFLVPSVCPYSSLPVSVSLPSGDFLPLSSKASSMMAVAASSKSKKRLPSALGIAVCKLTKRYPFLVSKLTKRSRFLVRRLTNPR